jgi:hypothetical protein
MSNLPLELQSHLAELSLALENRSPGFSRALQSIHKTLKQYPENVTLLSEDEIALIVQGLKEQTQTQFAISNTKGAGKSAAVAKIKQDVAGSLGF